MAARQDDIAEDEMDDQTSDQTGQNSAGQVSNSIIKFTHFLIQNVFKIKAKRSFSDAPILNCQTKLQNG